MYGSGATYHGGAGTASCERDICDVCWGSGDQENPFSDLLKREQAARERVAAATFEDFCKKVGGYVEPRHLELMAGFILAAGRKRKLDGDVSPFWWSMFCEIMASQFVTIANEKRADMERRKAERCS